MLTQRGAGVRRLVSCAVLLWAANGAAVPAWGAYGFCTGDCNGSGMVSVDELVTVVNIELGMLNASACDAFGFSCPTGAMCIDQLVASVGNALDGCPPPTLTTAGIVFNGEGNRLHAFQPGPGFPDQTVIPSNADVPGGVGRDLNAQICFTRGPDGQVRFIGGEDTNQGRQHASAGWGFFELTGSAVGEFQFQELGKLIPTYQTDDAENYGCGFLNDGSGRLLTTDVGNQAGGPGDGQLIIWFPPFDNGANYTETGVYPTTPAHYCKLDIAIGTAQQIAVDAQDRVYVSSARPNGAGAAGVFRYTGPFPTSDTPEGGCDGTDGTGAPMATQVTKELFIGTDGNIFTPAGVVIRPDGHFYVSSVINGVIAEYDADGHFVQRVLSPPRAGLPIPTGSPLGIGLASDGTIYYADIGLVIGPPIGPGNKTGSVRRIRFVDGVPQPPETMASGFDFPDGIGVLELPTPGVTPTPCECNTRRPTNTERPTATPFSTPRRVP
jgi:hypothetical protein